MGNIEDSIILFDKYINNELSATEKAAFEARLKTDTTFKEKFNAVNALTEDLRTLNQINEVKASLKKENFFKKTAEEVFREPVIIVEQPAKKEGSIISFKQMLTIAASIAILVLAWVFYPNNIPTTKSEIAFALKETNALTLGEGIAEGDIQLLQQKEAKQEPLSFSENLELGVAELKAAKGQKAYERLSKIRPQADTPARNAILDWLVALSLYQKGDEAAAINNLKSLPSEHPFKRYAVEFLQSI